MPMIATDNLNAQLLKKDEDNCIAYFDYTCRTGAELVSLSAGVIPQKPNSNRLHLRRLRNPP